MPKVTVKAGITLPGPKERSWFKGDIEFAEIDTGTEIGPQIQECLETVKQVAPSVEQALAQQAANLSGMAVEGAGIATMFNEFREKLRAAWDKLADKVEGHESFIEAVRASGVFEVEEEKPKGKAKK